MEQSKKLNDINFDILLRQDGDIECKFVCADGSDAGVLVCTAKQVGDLATGLLNAAAASTRLLSSQEPPSIGDTQLDTLISDTVFAFGATKGLGQKVLAVKIGSATVGFSILDERLRGLGRTMIAASWKTNTSVPLTSSLLLLLGDFFSDLGGWVGLLYRRANVRFLRDVSVIGSFVSGRSLHVFRNVAVGNGNPTPAYNAVNRCIYCEAKQYSNDPSIRKFPFGAEHIIAEGLGGTLELPDASCRECEAATGAVVEQDVLGRTMKALRVHLRLKKAGSGSHPKALPLEANVYGERKVLQIPIEDYPIVFFMCAMAPPHIDGPGGAPSILGVTLVRIKHNERQLFQKYSIGSFTTAVWDNYMVCRMLAKIAHSFAVAEVGLDKFKPLLTDLIRTGDLAQMRYVGGVSLMPTVSADNALHRLELGYQRVKNKTYLVSRIRLFANYGSPVYSVIVGESLEKRSVRFRRVFSSWICRVPLFNNREIG